jgi:LIVCS family branched-chain amino acid:cation transporter
MRDFKLVFTYGLALFAMFFGSGNLVFPIIVGMSSGNEWLVGFVGLFLTGVILPFMGLFVIKLYEGDYKLFFAESGRIGKILIPFFTLSLLGSFGVVPRCITVAHGGMEYLFNDLSLTLFSFLFSLASFVFGIKDKLLLNILGKILSPILVVTLAFLVIYSVIYSDGTSSDNSGIEALKGGFITGYQTMDLFAAFFFSSFIFTRIQDSLKKRSQKEVIMLAIKSSILASLMTSSIYLGFVYLGAHYSVILSNISPERYLPEISKFVLGENASILIAVSIFLSCITTAVALNNIYARFLLEMFRIKDRFFPIVLGITTIISFFISLFDFRNIAGFLAPLLEISYPGLIFLTIISICTKEYKKIKFIGFWLLTFLMIIYASS